MERVFFGKKTIQTRHDLSFTYKGEPNWIQMVHSSKYVVLMFHRQISEMYAISLDVKQVGITIYDKHYNQSDSRRWLVRWMVFNGR